MSTWTLPWLASASASGGAKERKKKAREREINEIRRECENEPRVRRVVLLNCTGCKIYSLSVSKEKKRILI